MNKNLFLNNKLEKIIIKIKSQKNNMAKKKTQLHYNGPDLKGGRNVGSSDAHASSFFFIFIFIILSFLLFFF